MVASGRSRSDAELARLLSEGGRHVSPWQVERWRQHGLIPSAARSYGGRGLGSQSVYTPAAIEQGRVVAALVRRRRPLGDVAVALFMRGYPVPEMAIKNAYAEWLDRLERFLGEPSSPDAVFDAAEVRAQEMAASSLRTKRGRKYRSRLRRRGEPADEVYVSVLTNLVLLLQGAKTTDDGLDEVLQAGGATAMYMDRIPGAGPIAPGPSAEVRSLMRKVSLEHLRHLVDVTTMEDFVWARDLIQLFVPFAAAFATMVRMMFRLPDALGFGVLADMEGDDEMLGYAIPIMLLLRGVATTPEAQGVIAMMRDQLPHFQAAAAFLQTLPAPVARGLARGDPGALDRLNPDERRRIREQAALTIQES